MGTLVDHATAEAIWLDPRNVERSRVPGRPAEPPGLAAHLARHRWQLTALRDGDALRARLRDAPPRAIFVPTSLGVESLRRVLAPIAPWLETGASVAVAVGLRPALRVERALRERGVRMLLARPWTDRVVRYQLNRLREGHPDGPPGAATRRAPRAPTDLSARFGFRGASRTTSLYTISREGAFLELDDPITESGELTLELFLAGARVALPSRIVRANPRRRQRTCSPWGTAVRFRALPAETAQRIDANVSARRASLEL